MTVELTMLMLSVGLLLVILVIQGTAGVIANGLVTQASARDDLPEQQVFHARTTRLRANMIENLLLFLPVSSIFKFKVLHQKSILPSLLSTF